VVVGGVGESELLMIVLVGNNEWTDRRVKGLELMSWLGEVKKKPEGGSRCLMYQARLRAR
jgi:hypothetical protein